MHMSQKYGGDIDSDYTSPNFIEQLLSKPQQLSYTKDSSSQADTFFDDSPQRQILINHRNQYRAETAKDLRYSRNSQQQCCKLSKFRIFYRTVMSEFKNQKQINNLWNNFQQAIKCPTKFDKFIQHIKSSNQQKIENIIQQPIEQKRNNNHLFNKQQKIKYLSPIIQSRRNISQQKLLSLKKIQLKLNQKNNKIIIKKQVKQIKNILQKNHQQIIYRKK